MAAGAYICAPSGPWGQGFKSNAFRVAIFVVVAQKHSTFRILGVNLGFSMKDFLKHYLSAIPMDSALIFFSYSIVCNLTVDSTLFFFCIQLLNY